MAKPGKREEIMRAARELIAENGFHGAPMALIAQKASVAAGTIYCYFENKDILITELFRDLEARAYRVITRGYAPDAPIRAQFLHLCTALLHYFIDNPLDFKYVEQFLNSPYGAAFRRGRLMGPKEEYEIFRELYEAGTATQELKDVPIVVFYALTMGPLLAMARDHILGFVRLDDRLIELTVEACWDSVKR